MGEKVVLPPKDREEIVSPEEWERRIAQADLLMASDPAKTLLLVEEILLQVAEDSTWYARALRTRAMAHGAMGDLEKAADDFRTARELSVRLADRRLESQCLHGLANVRYYRGEFAQALELIHQANHLRRVIGDEAGLMTGLINLGAFLAEMGDIPDAVSCFFDALQQARRLESPVNEALALTNIGHLKLENGEPDRAIAYLERSLEVSRSIGARVYEPFTLEVLASALAAVDRPEEAMRTAHRAAETARDLGNVHHEINALVIIAGLEKDRGECAQAERRLLAALEMAENSESGRSVARIYGSLGDLRRLAGDFERSEYYLQTGLDAASNRRQTQDIRDLNLALSRMYAARGDFEKALESHIRYHEAEKSLRTESLKNRLAAQIAQMEVERARQEAEIHRLRTVELADANREKEILLRRVQEQAQRLAELAITDPLTGLYNRRYLREYLARTLPETVHEPVCLTVALLDLDNFKQINDRFSHSVGDEVLKTTARLIRSCVRDSDIVVRYGGEEFVVALPEMRRSDAAPICERIRAVIAAYDWSEIHPLLGVTTSIGIADSTEEYRPVDGKPTENERILVLADKRLYNAKAQGKNRVL